MSTEQDVKFHPDRALAYARWLLSRNPARLNESDRRQLDFLRGAGQHILLKNLEAWEQGMKADGGMLRAYAIYVMTVHAVSLRVSRHMLPQRLVDGVWEHFLRLHLRNYGTTRPSLFLRHHAGRFGLFLRYRATLFGLSLRYRAARFGLRFGHGRSEAVSHDHIEAVKSCRKAADEGDAATQVNLGTMYQGGYGVAQDYAEALKWYRKAADQGDATGQHNLGLMFYQGLGVTQNYAEAAKWCRQAAEQGHAHAQYGLGVMYNKGRGVPQDNAEALKWYRKAVEQGLADAQYNLGWVYDQGLGVTQDDTEAVTWYRKAADQGHANAQFNLGAAYAKGQGAPKDYVLAYMWLSLAATNASEADRDGAITARELVASELTSEQLVRAAEMARDWKPTMPTRKE